MTASNDILIEDPQFHESSVGTITDFDKGPDWGISSRVWVVSYPRPLSNSALRQISKMSGFEELEPNWDSYGASPTSKTAIENAARFIRDSDSESWKVYFVSPGKNGEVLVELKGEDKLGAEVYFNPDSTKELLIFKGDNYLYEGDFNLDLLKKYFSKTNGKN